MTFLNPSYLWALLGLAIPIAIHLWSKKEGKTIKIGSIKLLSDEDSRQSSSISINELALLIMRMSLITLIVLILAEPQIKRGNTNTPITYIFEPSLVNKLENASLIDSLSALGSVRLLQNDFPEFTDAEFNKTQHEVPNYWQLAKEMETLRTDSIIVFTNAFAIGLKGTRPTVIKNIEWIILDSEETSNKVIEAILKKDQLELLSVMSNSKHLSYKKERISLNTNTVTINDSKDSVRLSYNGTKELIHLKTETPLKVLLFHENDLTNEATYIEAGLNAISKYLIRSIEVTRTQDSNIADFSAYQNVIWLSSTSVPLTTGHVLSYKPDNLADSMIIEGTSKLEHHLTKSLNSENIMSDHLTEQLISWLNLRPNLYHETRSLDKRIVNKAELLPIFQEVKTERNYTETLSISKWLWIILLLILITERIVANIRKQ